MRKTISMIAVATLMLTCLANVSFAAEKYIVATDTNFKPFSFKNSDGVYTGFDVEFWDAIAKEMKLALKHHRYLDSIWNNRLNWKRIVYIKQNLFSSLEIKIFEHIH